MAAFTEQQVAFLAGQRLGRLATVDDRGRPNLVTVGFRVDRGRLGPGFGSAWIRIAPERIVAWGLEETG
jgi:hypothetical protein